MALFSKPFNVFNSLFGIFSRRRKANRRNRLRTECFNVEQLEERILLTSSWLTGLASSGDYIIDNEGTDGIEFSVSSDGTVIIGGGETNRFELDAAGNLTLSGTLSTASSETYKENFRDIDPTRTLELINGLPLYGWNYTADSDSTIHVSPLAEDFAAFFGLGSDETRLAPSDLAGVTLVGIQGLSNVVESHRGQIQSLANVLGTSGQLPLPLFTNVDGTLTSLFDPIAVSTIPRTLTSSPAQYGEDNPAQFIGPLQNPPQVTHSQTNTQSTFTLFAATASGQPLSTQSHRSSSLVLHQDRVVNDDEVIIGHLAVGSKADNQPVGADTLRLSDDVLRIHFQDTSASSGFPTNDWRIVVNDEFLNGDAHFSIEDVDGGRVPFRIEAGDTGNALVIDESGNVGFGTDQPAANLQLVSADTPTIRLEQTDGTPQVWDVAGNETGFFVRDVTSGQILPFRILSTASADSLTIGSTGNVGVGTQTADAALHISSTDGTANLIVEETSTTVSNRDLLDLQNTGAGRIAFSDTSTGTQVRSGHDTDGSYTIDFDGNSNPEVQLGDDGSLTFTSATETFVLDASGNLSLSGTISTPSSVTLKENFVPVNTDELLQKVDDLSILLWNYISDPDTTQHVSPIAEDFYTTFQLGDDPKHIATADLGGIAVATIQSLYTQIAIQNEQIAYLTWVTGLEYEAVTPSSQTSSTSTTVSVPNDKTGTLTFESLATQQSSTSHDQNLASDWQRQYTFASTPSNTIQNGQLVLANATVDDSILRESLIVGDTSVNGVNPGFDSIRIQDDVIRVLFEDTSIRPGDSSNDWRIVINDETAGGDSHFSIVDVESGETRFRIDADAPEYALLVDAIGRLGVGTSTPQQDIHVNSGDTPTIRLEQSNLGEYASSSWDIAANEVNFFIQNSTTGETVPFRVHATAPTDSLSISQDGRIGVGVHEAGSTVHVTRDDGSAQVLVTEQSTTTAQRELIELLNAGGSSIAITDTSGVEDVTWRTGVTGSDEFTIDLASTNGSEFTIDANGQVTIGPDGAANFVLDTNGNLTIAGTLSQGSSYTLKENFSHLNSASVLDRLIDLPIYRWNYTDDGPDVQHLGPTAEDFYAAFGLGEDAQHLAASDLVTVALSGLQGLMQVAAHQGQQLEAITQTLGQNWTTLATWDTPRVPVPSTIDVESTSSSSADVTTQSVQSFQAVNPTMTTVETTSTLVIHSMQDGEEPHEDSHNLFLAETGSNAYFAWQDQDLTTPDITEIYYDFRNEDGYSNNITDTQQSIAIAALDSWEDAAGGSIQFVRNTTVDRSQIINLGLGQLEAFGFQGGEGGTLAVGGGIVSSGDAYTITNGVVWLDQLESWDEVVGNGDVEGTYDLATVFLHELGHALGLGHTDHVQGQDVMDGAYRGEHTTFSNLDIALIQTLYANATSDPIPDDGELVLLEDQVLNGDQTFVGNLGVGVDSSNGMYFGTDTIRISENNNRIGFHDTSTDGSPGADWQLTANSSKNGGQSYFSFDQQSTVGASDGSPKFRIIAGARQDAFVIDSANRIGLGTRSPEKDLHLIDSSTPTVRLGQDTSSGFASAFWDFGGDENGFYIQNVDNNQYAFQVATGSQADSLVIGDQGYIGVGHATPSGRFHIQRDDGSAQLRVEETSTGTADRDLVVLENNGGALIRMSNLAPSSAMTPTANNPHIGVAHSVDVAGSQVTFDLFVENLGEEALTNVELPIDLDSIFGEFNYRMTQSPVIVAGPSSILLDATFDGSDNLSLFDPGTIEGTDGRTGNSDPGSTLAVAESAHIRFVVTVDKLDDLGFGAGTYRSQVTVSARDSVGGTVTDLSDHGTDPDPNGNGDPSESGEDDLTEFSVAENPVIGLATQFIITDETTAFINKGGSNSTESGTRVVLTWTVENLGNVDLTNITLSDDLTNVFGAGNFGTYQSSLLPETTIVGGGSLSVDTNFNGSSQTALITNGTLSPGAIATITTELLVTTVADVGQGVGVYTHQASVSAVGPDSSVTTDLSDAGRVADSNFNGDPTETGEDDPTTFAIGSHLGAALTAEVTGNQVTLSHYLESFGNEDLSEISLIDNLDSVFGVGNYTITSGPTLIDDPGTLSLNSEFDGSSNNQLLEPTSTLSALDTAQISYTVTVHTLQNNGSGLGQYEHQVEVLASTPYGATVSDLSESGTNPDPNDDSTPGSAGEDTATSFQVVSDATIGVASEVSVSDSQITIDLYLENFGTSTGQGVSLTDDLDAVFGQGNYTISFAPQFIDDPGTLVLNNGFDGSGDTEILGAGSTLAAGDTAQIRFVVDVIELTDPANLGLGVYRHQAIVTSVDSKNLRTIDLSDANSDPDNFDNNQDPTSPGLQDPPVDGEDDPNFFLIGNVALGAALNTYVNGTEVTLDYTIENLGDHTITGISASHVLFSVIGFANYSTVTQPTLISGPDTVTLNASFDGTFVTALLSNSSLAAGEKARIRYVINVDNVTDQGQGFGVYTTSFNVVGTGPTGEGVSDQSDAGILSDSDADGDPTETGENDSTPFVIGEEPSIGVATTATVNGQQVTIDYYLENLGNQTLTNLALPQDLDAVFGTSNYTILTQPAFIDDPGTVTINSLFDGSSDTALFDANSSLAAGDTIQIRMLLDIGTLADRGFGVGTYHVQTYVTADTPSGGATGDYSTDGTDPDPNGNANPADVGESTATTFTVANSQLGVALDASVDGKFVTLTYTLENLGNTTLDQFSLTENLDSLFGSGNYELIGLPQLTSTRPVLVLNPDFNGRTENELIRSGSLGVGLSDVFELIVRVDQILPSTSGIYTHQVIATAKSPSDTMVSDVSDAGIITDANNNSDATESGENDATTIDFNLAESFVVTTLVDEDNGTADPIFGTGTSLREAIALANSTPGLNIITFANELVGQSVSLSQGWASPSDVNSLVIDDDLIINGLTSGAGIVLAIAPATQKRHFSINTGASLTLNNLTLSGGNVIGNGGAIENNGSLFLNGSTFTQNSASHGGAVFSAAGSTQLAITNSTFAGNTATESGGAVWSGASSTSVTATTIVDNVTGGSGGALAQCQSNVELTNVILSRNSNNTGTSPNFEAVNGGSISLSSSNNLIDVSADQLLVGTLADNGGPTHTVALLSGGPAIDNGLAIVDVETDQTLKPRLIGQATDIGASEFIPTNLVVTVLDSDTNDDYSNSDLSLYEAIKLAETHNDPTTITFDSNLFTDLDQTISLSKQFAVTNEHGVSAFTINTDITIIGPTGPNGVTLQSDFSESANDEDTYRAFLVQNEGRLSLANLTLTGFSARGVEQSMGDQDRSQSGGAIYVNGGELKLNAVLLTNNSAVGSSAMGGAIYVNNGSASLINSTLSGNSAVDGLQRSQGETNGGGIAIENSQIDILNSTIANNTASSGGAVYVLADGATSELTMNNTILADSTASSDYAESVINGGIVSDSGTHNLIELGNQLFDGLNTIVIDADLLALADNGGPTRTHRSQPNSPVIDAGSAMAATSLLTDQRGQARVVRGTIDLGAVEAQPMLSVVADSASQSEGNDGATEFTFTVSRTNSIIGETSVDYTVSGSEVTGTDFVGGTLPSGTVMFNHGESTKTITVLVASDNTVEADEMLTVTLSNASSETIIETTTANATILNDDSATVAIQDVSQDEDTGMMTFTISLSQPVNSDVQVNYTTVTDSATSSDFTATSGTATIEAGSLSTTVNVLVASDSIVELDERFELQLSNLQANNRNVEFFDSRAFGTIRNDEIAVVSVADVSQDEDSGDMAFTISLDHPVDVDVLVDFNTVTNTAGHSDFVAKSGIAVIPAGSQSTTVTIPVLSDNTVELDERFELQLSNARGSDRTIQFGDSQAAGIIRNDDAAVISISNATQNEDTGEIVFTISMDQPLDTDVQVSFSTLPDSATSNDFNPSSGMVTINAGTLTSTLKVPVAVDNLVELDERFFVNLSNQQAAGRSVSIGRTQAEGILVNDDTAQVVITDASANEDAGEITFTIAMDRVVDADVHVDFNTLVDTASQNDFTATSGIATIAAGSLSTTVTVPIVIDSTVEFDERFQVLLSNLRSNQRNVQIGDSRAFGTIRNDDSSMLSVLDVESHEDTGELVFTVVLSHAVDADVQFDFSTMHDSTTDHDVTLTSGTATVPAGLLSTTIRIPVTVDSVVERNEQFFIDLSNLRSNGRAVSFGDQRAIGTIVNDDVAGISIVDVVQDEDAGEMIFTITMDRLVETDVQVDFSTQSDSARSDDFMAKSGTVTIPAGALSTTIEIPITSDGVVERDERFEVRLTNPRASSRAVEVRDTRAFGTIRNDDVANISIADVSLGEDAGEMVFTISLDRLVDENVLIDFNTVADIATANDFTELSGTATIPAGQLTTTIGVSIIADLSVELDERFQVQLANANASGRKVQFDDSRAFGTILNDDAATVSIGNATATEDSGFISFLVSLDQPVDTEILIDFDVLAGTADESDLASVPSFASIPANTTNANLVIELAADRVVELTERFHLELTELFSDRRDVRFDNRFASGIIQNDDFASLSVSNVSIPEGDQGERELTFTVTLDAAVDVGVSVDFATQEGTATANEDYTPPENQTLNFLGLAGETRTVSIRILSDVDVEDHETLTALLSNLNATGRNVTLANAVGTGKIVNDDLDTNTGQLKTESVAKTTINVTYSEIVSGNFDGTPALTEADADDLFFWNPVTGDNRIVFGDGSVQTNAIPTSLINGRDFTHVYAGNLDEGGGTDLFFWNPLDGRNRLIHLNGETGNVVPAVQHNFVSVRQINGGDYSTLTIGNFDGGGADDFFFWDPVSGRNRLYHLAASNPGFASNISNVQTDVIDRTIINGEFQAVRVGQFIAGGMDELLFIDLETGRNRIVSLSGTRPGISSSLATFQTDVIPQSVFNGREFDQIEVADLNGDGLDDVFAWNTVTGVNRVSLTDPTPGTTPKIVKNLFGSQGINNDYRRVVQLTDELFSSPDFDELFFWNPETGQNRVSQTS